MREFDLLRSPSKIMRDVSARRKSKEKNRRLSMKFGWEYFDGPREQGYGGYSYDGRWIPVARRAIDFFSLKPGDRVLDIGCAKGFLVKDLILACPGIEAFGVDISEYALMHCEKEVIGRLHLGAAHKLLFPDDSFAAVLCINVLHNCDRPGVVRALKEIQRISGGHAFIQVDSYHTAEQRQLFLDWVLTAEFHDYPNKWRELFVEAGYTGDYFWTICE
jgi:SAM-dependent methyltransferase